MKLGSLFLKDDLWTCFSSGDNNNNNCAPFHPGSSKFSVACTRRKLRHGEGGILLQPVEKAGVNPELGTTCAEMHHSAHRIHPGTRGWEWWYRIKENKSTWAAELREMLSSTGRKWGCSPPWGVCLHQQHRREPNSQDGLALTCLF